MRFKNWLGRIALPIFIIISLLVTFIPQPAYAVSMTQVILGGYYDALDIGSTEYNTVMGGYIWIAVEDMRWQLVSRAGTISQLFVELSAAPGAGAGDGYSFTLRKNGADTTLTCTITQPATSASNTANSVAVVAGDYIDIKCVPLNTPSASPYAQWSMQFASGAANESLLLGNQTAAAAGSTYYSPVQAVSNNGATGTEADNQQPCPTTGTIKNLYAKVAVAPGVGNTYIYMLRKNGADTTLTCTIAGAATTANDVANSVAVVAGDLLDVRCTATAGAIASQGCTGMTFVATTNGESIIAGCATGDDLNNAATEYNSIGGGGSVNWNATEAQLQQLAGVAFSAKNLYIALTGSPGGGKSYAFMLRQDSDVTALTCTVADANTTASDTTHTVLINSGGNLDLRVVPSGTPTVRDAKWSMVCYFAIPPSVSTLTTIPVEETTATFNGNVTAVNDTNITARGFVWDTSSHVNPGNTVPPATYSANYTEYNAWPVGAFSYNKTGLTKGELYYLRACAKNDDNLWNYGGETTFLTKPDEPSGLTCTQSASGTLSFVWEKGIGAGYTVIKYSSIGYPADPTVGTLSYNDTGIADSEGGLISGTTYYFRAWSWASEGGLNQYSDLYSQTSCKAMDAPTVTTSTISGITKTSVTANGAVGAIGAGGTSITDRGFNYGATDAYGEEAIESGSFGAGSYGFEISGLEAASAYHYQAKAKNTGSGGLWGYGADAVFSTQGMPTLYEYHNTTCNSTAPLIYGNNWDYQTFSTNTTAIAHTVKTVRVFGRRLGDPQEVTISIKNVTGGKPSGESITSAVVDGMTFSTVDSWFSADMDSEVGLEYNHEYCVEVKAPSGDNINYVSWNMTAYNDYSGGLGGRSADSGGTWTYNSSWDYCFEIWGNPTIEMLDAKVFKSYLETGDWLIVCLYYNIYPPYYDDGDDPSLYFYLQLVDGTTVKAQTRVAAWGYKPGSIYLSAKEVEDLEWGKAYKVRMYGDFAGYPYVDYTLKSIDWLGSDMDRLASWVLTACGKIESFYGETLTTFVTGKGRVLNSQGGAIFVEGIPELDTVIPNIFETATGSLSGTPGTYTPAENAWEEMWGPYVTRTFTIMGNTMNLSGGSVGAILFFAVYIFIGVVAFPTGHSLAGISISFPVILAMFYTGFVPLAIAAAFYGVSVLMLVREYWLKGG
jgi:hypothetical protein